MLVLILQEGTSMTNEAVYLVLVIVAFLAFAGTLSILSRQGRR